MKTRVEILKEIAENYNSKNHIGCYSRTFKKPNKTSDCCPVGRFFKPDAPIEIWNSEIPIEDIFSKYKGNIEVILKEDVSHTGRDLDFWMEVQNFADTESNWNETGLSEKGEKILASLIEDYTNYEDSFYIEQIEIKEFLNNLEKELNNQDNRMTRDPVFEVWDTIKHRVCNVDDEEDCEYEKENKYLTSFLTQKSADDYIEYNRHNLHDPYVFVNSMYNNPEMRTLRKIIKEGKVVIKNE